MTTIEFCAKMSENENSAGESVYDAGLLSNITAVLGSNPLLWFLPIGEPTGDGIRFPVCGEGASASGPSAGRKRVQLARHRERTADECVEDCDGEAPEAAHPACVDTSSGLDDQLQDEFGVPAETTASSRGGGEFLDVPIEITSPDDDAASENLSTESRSMPSDMLLGDEEEATDYEQDEEVADEKCFLAWSTPDEFQEDFQIGVEVISETFEDVVRRFASGVASLRHCLLDRRKPSRRSSAPAVSAASWRRTKTIPHRPVRTSSAPASSASGADFSDFFSGAEIA
jgi:hypothetical protein